MQTLKKMPAKWTVGQVAVELTSGDVVLYHHLEVKRVVVVRGDKRWTLNLETTGDARGGTGPVSEEEVGP